MKIEGEALHTQQAQHHNRRNTNPNHWTDESLAQCHPYVRRAELQRSSTPPCLCPAEWEKLPDRCRSIGIILRFMLEEVIA